MRRTVKCAAVGCPNRTDQNISKEISFHGFPLDPVKKAEWVLALNRKNWKPTTQSILCSEHFLPQDLDKTTQYVRVHRNAIPSIFPHQSASKQQEVVSKIEQSSQENPSTRPNSSHNTKVTLVYESSSNDSLSLEVFPEELSSAQLSFRNQYNKELDEINQKIKDMCNQLNREDIYEDIQNLSDSFTNTSSANRKRKRSSSGTSPEKEARLKLNNNSHIVLNPKQCVVVGTLTPALHLPTNLKPSVQLKPEPKRRGRKSRVRENSKPNDISFNAGTSNGSFLVSTSESNTIPHAAQMVPDRSESRAFGGLIIEGTTNDSLLLSRLESNAKLHASQMVIAKPHLMVKEFTENDKLQLDTHVKTVLSYAPKEFTEWLFQNGLLKSFQTCISHPSVQLKLSLYNDVTKFPYSGGYLWFSDCCPDKIVSVYNGSLFESSSYSPSEILKLIYHWSCETKFKDMAQLVKVDNSYIRLMNSRLRAICTIAVQADVGLLGGPGKKVEIGITTLMGTQLSNNDKGVKVAVLGVLEPETKQIRLSVLELNFDEDSQIKQELGKILGFLLFWIHPGSVAAIDTTMDENVLFNGGFTDIQRSVPTDPNPCNKSIMKYLREILPRMFENTFSWLTINVIQQFLDELVWRERYSTTPSECFSNIMTHISQQSERFNSIVSRLAEVSANPLKNWRP